MSPFPDIDITVHSKKRVAIDDLDADSRRDLIRQLKNTREELQERYASFVVSLCEAVENTNVSFQAFKLYLLGLSALENDYLKFEDDPEVKQPILLEDVKAQIDKANSINDIFIVLTTESCCFINVGVFQSIMNKYGINVESDEDLQYSKHLKVYLENHKISEFIFINSRIERLVKDSEELIVHFDVDLSSKISKIADLHGALAKVLGVKMSALRLVAIKKDRVVVTFNILTSVAKIVFSNGLTTQQEADIRALSVLWLKCGDYKLRASH